MNIIDNVHETSYCTGDNKSYVESPWPIGLQAGNEICHRYTKIIECAICFENFTVPKILQCGHTFCEKCLQELYNASGQPGYLTCPTCRTTTSVPANDIAGLRTDFRANQMRDAIGSFTQRNRPNENVCNQCEQRQKVVAAAWRCSTCEKKYCQSCVAET